MQLSPGPSSSDRTLSKPSVVPRFAPSDLLPPCPRCCATSAVARHSALDMPHVGEPSSPMPTSATCEHKVFAALPLQTPLLQDAKDTHATLARTIAELRQ